MTFFRLIPVFLSFLLLAAHFSRADNPPMIVACLAAPFLLLMRRKWVASTIQITLVLGTLEWVKTLVVVAQRRHSMGESWLRMAVILAAVALVTVCSALVFRSRALRERYAR